MGKKFLVAVDGSEHGWKAADLAADLAKASIGLRNDVSYLSLACMRVNIDSNTEPWFCSSIPRKCRPSINTSLQVVASELSSLP